MSMTEDDNRELKNAIFAAKAAEAGAQGKSLPQGVQGIPGIPMMSQAEAAQQQLGFNLEVASVPLPSKGLLYDQLPLAGAESIDIKAMTAREEDILMNQSLIKKGTVITELIKSCIMDKSIDVNTLISGDRNALMVAVRMTGYGSEYTPKVKCRGCDTEQDFSVDLSTLPIKELDVEKLQQAAPGQNAFNFQLPVTKKLVTFKFLTGKEEEKIVQEIEARRKRGIVADSPITTKLMNSIVAIDGNTDRGLIAKFCQFMPARDSLALRKQIDENEPSIDMSTEFTCPACSHSEVLAIPLGASFFWPNARG